MKKKSKRTLSKEEIQKIEISYLEESITGIEKNIKEGNCDIKANKRWLERNRLLLEVAKKGANLINLYEALSDENPFLELFLSSIKYKKADRKEFQKRKRILETIETYVSAIPEFSIHLRDRLNEEIGIIISHMEEPPKVEDEAKKLGISLRLKAPETTIWNEKIFKMVNTLLKAGHSKNKSYEIVGKLLNLSFPDWYKDKDPDLVRHRYSYYKKKTSLS